MTEQQYYIYTVKGGIYAEDEVKAKAILMEGLMDVDKKYNYIMSAVDIEMKKWEGNTRYRHFQAP